LIPLNDTPLIAELERLRFENKRLRALVNREQKQAEVKLKLDTGVKRLRRKPYRYPIPTMEVGQSFFIPLADKTRLRSLTWYWGNKMGKRFTVRVAKLNGVKGCRVVRWE
jgi:hypothetical protein